MKERKKERNKERKKEKKTKEWEEGREMAHLFLEGPKELTGWIRLHFLTDKQRVLKNHKWKASMHNFSFSWQPFRFRAVQWLYLREVREPNRCSRIVRRKKSRSGYHFVITLLLRQKLKRWKLEIASRPSSYYLFESLLIPVMHTFWKIARTGASLSFAFKRIIGW